MTHSNKRLLILGAAACIGWYFSVAHDAEFAHLMNATTWVATVGTLIENHREEDEKNDRDRS
jgi:hypothetical protein